MSRSQTQNAPLDTLYRRIGRSTSMLTLLVFVWISAQPWHFAAAQSPPSAELKQRAAAARTPTPIERFEETVADLGEAAARSEARWARGEDPAEEIAELETHRAALAELDGELRTRLDALTDTLSQRSLPAVALQRQQEMLARYESRSSDLDQRLDALLEAYRQSLGEASDGTSEATAETTSADGPSTVEEARAVAREHARGLQAWVGDSSPAPPPSIDPNNLPFRTAEPVDLESVDLEAATDLSQVAGASSGESRLEGLAGAATAPTPADLAETLEVQLTPEIQALASDLDNDPLRIYNFVRDTIDFHPTRGSKLGAQGCLDAGLCNATDTASLLIALLRAAGVPARYATGTVEGSVDRIANWVGGFTDAGSALNLMASGGIPVTGLLGADGELSAARFEHVWVEAFINYLPSRGGAGSAEGDTWVPLDPSFKQYDTIEGADLQGILDTIGFNGTDLLLDTQATGTLDTDLLSVSSIDTSQFVLEVEGMREDALQHLEATSPDITLAELLGDRQIRPLGLSVLPASLPLDVLTGADRFSEVPDSLRHKVSVSLATALNPFSTTLSFQAPMVQVLGKSLTVSYLPATPEDEAIAESFGGILETPPHLIQMRAFLRLEGDEVASGGSMPLGTLQNLAVRFDDPSGRRDRVEHQVNAGGYYAIVIGDNLSPRAVEKRGESMEATLQQQTATKDELVGQMLDALGRNYFAQVDVISQTAQRTFDVVNTNLGREGLLGAGLRVGTLFGTPVEVSLGGMFIDVKRDLNAPIAKDGNDELPRVFMTYSGAASSALEHGIFESFMNTEGVSAVKLLQVANDTGVAIHFLNRDNVDQVLPLLDLPSRDLQAFRDGVNAGKIIYTPQRTLNHAGFQGIGYAILDPVTGAGGYIISGGLAGGQAEPDEETGDFLSQVLSFLKNAGLFLVGLFTSVIGVVVNFISLVVDIYNGYQNGTATLGEIALAIGLFAAFTALSLWIGLPSLGLILAGAIYGGVLIGGALGVYLGAAAVILAFLAIQLLIFHIANLIIGGILAFVVDRRRDTALAQVGSPARTQVTTHRPDPPRVRLKVPVPELGVLGAPA